MPRARAVTSRRALASPGREDAGDGQLVAAAALGRTVLRPDVTDVLDDFKRLTTDEAKARFADHFLTRTAHVMDEIWPTFYELLKRVEEGELYRDPAYLNGQSFGSFADYFEHRVKRPFSTWGALEGTYHYARDYAPDLFGETLDKARQVQEADERDRESQRSGGRPKTFDNVQGFAPTGNAQAAALRRLRKDAPELHAEVLAGRISPHAAMIRAGFRRPTGTVRYDDPESAAKTLRKHMPPEARRRLAELLTQEDKSCD